MKNKDLLDKKEEIKHATLLKKSHLKSLEKSKLMRRNKREKKLNYVKYVFIMEE